MLPVPTAVIFPYRKIFMKVNYVSLETKHVPAVGTWSFDPDHNPSSLFHFSTCSDNLQGSICTYVVFHQPMAFYKTIYIQ